MDRPYKCSCGAAASDWGELRDHMLVALGESDAYRDHQWRGPGEEPEQVIEARARKRRREELRGRLVELADAESWDELREALR